MFCFLRYKIIIDYVFCIQVLLFFFLNFKNCNIIKEMLKKILDKLV